ncbi:TrmH family RNA methyltransferase [Candidatus Neptunochlamydia vexilliferae]|uniref:TrmH family RNA methyltransferase n=1 Tax=Candidatus Neptunichlamydia vexilliferae TaxID=1651774 RepID=UPI00189112A4|nr:RNA methyltransferase [Candidatus Neptunochlamydia vexilliferae]
MVPKTVTSLQHPIVKHLVKLRKERLYRDEKGFLLLEGKKMILEFQGEIETLITTEETSIPAKNRYVVPPEVIKKIADTSSPEPYLAEVPLPPPAPLEGKRLIALDRINDPGNLGTLLRTALALGFEGVFLLSCADPFSPKALRAAKGATFHLPIRQGSEEELLSLMSNRHIYVADAQGMENTTFTTPLILVLGSEAHGPSPALKSQGTLISIPMSDKAESLNVAVAGGILMHKMGESR